MFLLLLLFAFVHLSTFVPSVLWQCQLDEK